MKIVADLHVHTQASDGIFSPEDVVSKAVNLHLSAIAITDHDTIEGIDAALVASSRKPLLIIPGVELSTEYMNHEIHILGLCIDHTHQDLRSLLTTLHQSRFTRAEKMVKKLSELGYFIELDEVLEKSGKAAPGRPHIARVLMEKGYYGSVSEVFNQLLGYKMPGYVERYKLTPKEAIEIIGKAGGVASWAHPGLTGNDNLLDDFIACGLQGIEAYHPDHDEETEKRYIHLAQTHGMFASGGSDFHGGNASHSRDLAFCGLTETEFQKFLRQCKLPSL